MKKIIIMISMILILAALWAEFPDGNELLSKIDENMLSNTMKAKTTMIVQTKRASPHHCFQ